MDTLSIILIAVIATLVVAFIIVLAKKKPDNDSTLNKLAEKHKQEMDALEKEHLQSKSQIESELENATARLVELERLRADELKKSADRIAELEKEISNAIETGADDAIKSRLAEAKELAKKVEELENELQTTNDAVQSSEDLKAEIDKLKKKIKGLEDDLEEAEDDVEESRKTAKKLQANIQQLQDDLSKAEREAKQYLNDFNETKEKLTKLEKELELRGEALDFVTEVLTAQLSSDANVSKRYKEVDAVEDFVSGNVRDTLKNNGCLSNEDERQFFGDGLKSWSIVQKKTWIQGKTAIAFVGEFSAGKTSIVNRILSQDDSSVPLLPTSTKATTAVPTYITGGVSTFYQFVDPDNNLKGISENTFKRVSKEVLDQVKGVSQLIQYFVMTYKNPYLNKMSILDTPGFSSNDKEDAERTIEVINECDALFWVIDVNTGTVNRSSIKTIKEHLKKPLYVVINQIDTKSKEDVDAVEKLIRKTLSDEGITLCDVIRFSKEEPLKVMMDVISKVSGDKSRESLLDNLIDFMSEKLKVAEAEMKDATNECNKIETNYDTLIGQINQTLGDLEQTCHDVSEIPEYNEHIFKKDDYKISQEQYDLFCGLLQSITDDHMQSLINFYNEQRDIVSDFEAAYQKHSEATSKLKEIEKCLNDLKKKSKVFLQRNYSSDSSVNFILSQSETTPRSSGSSATRNKNVSTKNTSNAKKLTRKQIDELIDSATTGSTFNSIYLNWDKLVNGLNQLAGCRFSRNDFQYLMGYPGALSGTSVDSYDLRQKMYKKFS